MKHQETHPDLDVDGCFGCKVAGVGVTYQGGQQQFHDGGSIYQAERDHVRELKAAGTQFERAT